MSKCPSCNVDHSQKSFLRRVDWLFWSAFLIVAVSYFYAYFGYYTGIMAFESFSYGVLTLINRMWWGIVAGMIFFGLLEKVPRSFVPAVFGRGGSVKGIFRATAAGVLLDLCSHGILMVGAKLYQKGASLGQVMAFLIASPWNSFSLTVILWALIGWEWTVVFILLSMGIAVVSGLIFDRLVTKKVLDSNPVKATSGDSELAWKQFRKDWKAVKVDGTFAKEVVVHGFLGSRMIVRWLFVGVVIAALLRTFVSIEQMQTLLGPSLMGLGITLVVATVVEVCSEGATPIAADIVTRAKAPGNGFVFLMAGVSTDYTEMIVLKETLKSWKMALFLPLVTLPQILLLGWILNQLASI